MRPRQDASCTIDDTIQVDLGRRGVEGIGGGPKSLVLGCTFVILAGCMHGVWRFYLKTGISQEKVRWHHFSFTHISLASLR
jgi:hypothetical protein